MTSATTKVADTATYASAYAQLSAIAQRLKGPTTAATIDDLAQDIRTARAAHAICKERLEAIRREIDLEITADQSDAEPRG